MSLLDNGSTGKAGVKTLAIRLEPDLHAQLSLIAQLRANTITDEIRTALEAHIASAKDKPELAAKAASARAEIEREALARRAAISTLFGDEPPTEMTDVLAAESAPTPGGSLAEPTDGPENVVAIDTAPKPATGGRPRGGRPSSSTGKDD